MALNIRHPETENLVNRLADLTGETKTEAVRKALEDRLKGLQRESGNRRLADELEEIALRMSRLPVLDSQSANEILGYDEDGLPR